MQDITRSTSPAEPTTATKLEAIFAWTQAYDAAHRVLRTHIVLQDAVITELRELVAQQGAELLRLTREDPRRRASYQKPRRDDRGHLHLPTFTVEVTPR